MWLHLAVGRGLLYMGDNCPHSILYAADAPPPAATVIIDASYGDYDKPFATSWGALDAAAAAGPLPLPSVPAGRGPEMALHLARRGLNPALDDTIRKAIAGLVTDGADCLIAGAATEPERPAQTAPNAGRPEGDGGGAGDGGGRGGEGADRSLGRRQGNTDRVHRLSAAGLAGGDTGEVRRATIRRNIHPLLSDNAELLRSVGARVVLPAFGGDKAVEAMKLAFAPARVVVGKETVGSYRRGRGLVDPKPGLNVRFER